MDPTPPPLDAVLVLAGGESRRLGRPKAWIDWDGRPLLARVVDRLADLAPEALVVGRPGQELPETPARRVDDDRPGEGPLAGLATGLGNVEDRLGPRALVAVSACDHPFADPELFRALATALGDADVALPRHEGRVHGLQGVWRAGLAEACDVALERGDRRVLAAVDATSLRIVEAGDLPGRIDLGRALLNVNDSGDLERARSAGRGSGGA